MKAFRCKLRSIILTAVLLWSATSMAQTIILNETFENGSGTSLSNWTFANGSQTNKWYVGTSTYYSGSRSAYISNNSGSNSYSTGYSSIVHLYRDVYLPSGSYLLSFNWKGNGESGYDYMQVFLVATTVTPTAGTDLSGSYTPGGTYNGYSTWQQEAGIYQIHSNMTVRLVFSWKNDGSGGSSPPAAIDNVVIAALSTPITANLTTAGTLKNVSNIRGAGKLTLTGNIDARDFQFMRDSMPYLSELDISGAKIVAYSGTAGTIYNSYYTYPVDGIPKFSFYYVSSQTGKTSLTSVTFPNSVMSIGDSAFYNCTGLTGTLTIPNSVTSIGCHAFVNCSNIDTLNFNAPNCTMGYKDDIYYLVFYGCSSLSTVIIGNNVQMIPPCAFGGSGVTSVTIPNSVTDIGFGVFYNCSSLTSVTIPNSVITIANSVFYNCSSLTSVTIPNSVITIANFVFYNCSGLTSVTIPNSVTTIDRYAFGYCNSLTSVSIPNSVTTIGNCAFYSCSGLRSVIIGNSVTTVGDSSFYGCSGLTEMYVKAINPPSVGNDAFYNISSNIPVHVPCGTTTAYQSATRWGNFRNIIDDLLLFAFSVQSNDVVMGRVNIIQANSCTNNTAIIGATYNQGYRFVGWNDGILDNPRTITVTQDTSFTAIFAMEGMLYVSVMPNNTIMGTVSGSGNYAANTTATIRATPNSGYRWRQWNDGNTQNPRTITVTRDTSFIAIFEAPPVYQVTVTANNSSMGTVSGSGNYAENTTATIRATSNANYHFAQWNDGNTQNPRTITVTQDTSFMAMFEDIPVYHVTVTTNDSEKGTVSGEGDYSLNTSIIIKATTKAGYRFVHWNDGNTVASRTITVTQDTNFMAIFAISDPNKYHVTVLANKENMGTVAGDGDYERNTTISIVAFPNQGYRFAHWNDGNVENPHTVTVAMRDLLFIAIFEARVSITDIEAPAINVYPNPAKDNIYITLPENISQAVFALYDIQGKVLIRKEIGSQETLSVSNLAGGIYIYHVITDKQTHTGKIIIKN